MDISGWVNWMDWMYECLGGCMDGSIDIWVDE